MPWNHTNEPPWKAVQIRGFWSVTTDRGDPSDEFDVDASGDEEVIRLEAAAPALRAALARYRADHDQHRWPQDGPCRCELCNQAEKAIKTTKVEQ